MEAAAMTISHAVAKILAASSVQQLREATAEGFKAISVESQLMDRVKAVELKLEKMEAIQ